jgi:hypothetical protein
MRSRRGYLGSGIAATGTVIAGGGLGLAGTALGTLLFVIGVFGAFGILAGVAYKVVADGVVAGLETANAES